MSHQHIKLCSIFLILNKIDKLGPDVSENDVLLKIKISNRTLQSNKIKRHMVSVKDGTGLKKAFEDLYE